MGDVVENIEGFTRLFNDSLRELTETNEYLQAYNAYFDRLLQEIDQIIRSIREREVLTDEDKRNLNGIIEQLMQLQVNINDSKDNYNTKLYLDSIHFEVLKTICEKKTILNNLPLCYNLNKITNNFKLINKLKFASNDLNWKNIPKKTNIFLLLLKHKNLIYYNDKINKNIILFNK